MTVSVIFLEFGVTVVTFRQTSDTFVSIFSNNIFGILNWNLDFFITSLSSIQRAYNATNETVLFCIFNNVNRI